MPAHSACPIKWWLTYHYLMSATIHWGNYNYRTLWMRKISLKEIRNEKNKPQMIDLGDTISDWQIEVSNPVPSAPKAHHPSTIPYHLSTSSWIPAKHRMKHDDKNWKTKAPVRLISNRWLGASRARWVGGWVIDICAFRHTGGRESEKHFNLPHLGESALLHWVSWELFHGKQLDKVELFPNWMYEVLGSGYSYPTIKLECLGGINFPLWTLVSSSVKEGDKKTDS